MTMIPNKYTRKEPGAAHPTFDTHVRVSYELEIQGVGGVRPLMCPQ